MFMRWYHHPNICGKYLEGCHNFMIDYKHGYIPFSTMMFTCTSLHHALLGWHKNTGVCPTALESQMKMDIPDWSNYLNHKNDRGQIPSSCTATGHKLLTLSDVEYWDKFLMSTCNRLLESYQQRVYKYTFAPGKYQIQYALNQNFAVAISFEAVCVNTSILSEY
jgi:hypothetical protein